MSLYKNSSDLLFYIDQNHSSICVHLCPSAVKKISIYWLLICITLLSLPFSNGQENPLSLPITKAEVATDNTEDPKTRTEQWLKEARATFNRLSDSNVETQLPPGIDIAALNSYRRDLEQLTLGINRYQKIINAAPEARKALEATRAAETAWAGFQEKPPYSILMLDELINQQDDIQKQSESYRSSLTIFNRELSNVQEAAKNAEKARQELLNSAADNPNDGGAAKWRLDADKAKSRVLAVRAFSLQSNIGLLNDQIEAAKIRLSLLNRQITIVEKNLSFSDEDLTKIKTASDDRRETLQKEIITIAKRQKDALAARTKQQAALDQLLKTFPEGTPPPQTPEFTLASTKLEAAEAKTESLQFISEKLESLIQLESYIPEVYQNRKSLLKPKSAEDREAAFQFLQANYDRLKAWEVVINNELAAINADTRTQESRAASIPPDDPRTQPISELRNAVSDKQTTLLRVSQTAAYQSRTLKRWLDDADKIKASLPFIEKAKLQISFVWKMLKSVWNFPIYEYGRGISINGEGAVRYVTLGQILTGLVFFSLMYFIALRIKDRLRNFVIKHKYIADAQARTLSNWLMIFVGFLLAIVTLQYLKIPLTIFAFLGGALVIGIGFGTQTLIKNFISGIIILFERKIRVGDVVDVGGGTGVITEINTRSSVLRSSDGKETLIPNSLFLENKVTNLTLTNKKIQQTLKISTTLNVSPQIVSDILKDCVERHGLVAKEPSPIITLDDFTDKTNSFVIYYWIELNEKTNSAVVASDIRFILEKRFADLKLKSTAEATTPITASPPSEA